MSGVKKLSELRAKAYAAHQAVIAEEDRLRSEYDDALTALHDAVEETLDEAKWVVALRGGPKGESAVTARPGWASKDTLRVTFHFTCADAPDAFEDPLHTAVRVRNLARGEVCQFSTPPLRAVLLAVVKAYMEAMSPPGN